MQRKARAGHVTGGRVFGYDNVEVRGPDGTRSHVERRINEAEAAVLRRMFEMCAAGAGLTRITKTLNGEGVPSPRAQLGRPQAWAKASVRAVLRRPLYAGEVVWNRSRKRDGWGRHHQHARPETEWLHVAAPSLQIIPTELWQRVQTQLEARASSVAHGDRSSWASPHLLSGFARCAICGGGFASHSREHGKRRVQFYGCTSHWARGKTVCSNGLIGRMDIIDAEVLATLQDDVFRPSVIERAVEVALETFEAANLDEQREHAEGELAAIDAEHAQLMAAVQRGGSVDTLARLVGRLQALQARREALTKMQSNGRVIAAPRAAVGLERRIRAKLDDWRGLLARNRESGREVLKLLLTEPFRFSPEINERGRRYRFKGAIALDRVVEGVIELKSAQQGYVPSGNRQSVEAAVRRVLRPEGGLSRALHCFDG